MDGIKSVPVKCDKLIDDPEALTEYRKITNPEPAPPPLKLIDEKMEGDMNSCKNLVEIEKYLQESSKGHLAYKPWSSYTVNALAQIYTNYPCTEAGLLALMDILIVIWRPDYLYYCANADMQDIETTMHDHIIKNYPNTWETELIKYWEDNRKIKGNWNLERISKNALLIQYCENNNLLGNKYFLLFTQRGQSQSNFIAKLYNNSARIYFANGRNARTESVKRTGKLSSEAVDYCQKGFNIFEEGIKKYPNTIELRYNEKGIPNATGAETCYNMVHRLDFYKDK